MKDLQPSSHPLKWDYLIHLVETRWKDKLNNPDIYIEDIRRSGACIGVEPEVFESEIDECHFVEASFSVIADIENNRIVIRHHF